MRRPRWSIILAVPVLVGWSLPMNWRLKKADRLYREGKHSEAAEVYQDVYLQRPDDAAAGYNLGTAQYKADDHESAAATLRGAAVSADTTLSARAFYNLGNAQYRLGQWQEAAEAYRHSLLYDPDDADAKHNLELVLRKMQEARQQTSQPAPQDQEQERSKEQQRDESGQEQRGQEEQPAPEQAGQDSLPQPMPQPARRDTMSQQDAERLLEAIAEEEMEALKEARNVPRVQERPVGADW